MEQEEVVARITKCGLALLSCREPQGFDRLDSERLDDGLKSHARLPNLRMPRLTLLMVGLLKIS